MLVGDDPIINWLNWRIGFPPRLERASQMKFVVMFGFILGVVLAWFLGLGGLFLLIKFVKWAWAW